VPYLSAPTGHFFVILSLWNPGAAYSLFGFALWLLGIKPVCEIFKGKKQLPTCSCHLNLILGSLFNFVSYKNLKHHAFIYFLFFYLFELCRILFF